MLAPLKRTLAAAAFALSAALPAFAEAPAAPAAAPAVEMKPGNPAIWTIAKPGGGTITLFGSVHLLPPNQSWRTPAFSEALAKADVVVFETPIADMQTPELLQYLAANMMNPPGVTLSTLLSPEEKAVVEKAANSVGATLAAMEAYRPWIVSLQLGVSLIMKQGFDPNSGVDKTVEAEARAAGKALDYFETAKEQLDIFISMPSEQERNMLVVGAQEIIDNPNSITEMVAAWASADTASLDKLLNEGLESDPALGKKLLEDRNANWVAKITGPYMADTKNYLIIVGAGHLAGDKGVPSMLRAKGIEVAGP